MIEIKSNEQYLRPNITVLGVGGAGNNALNRMIEGGTSDVRYIAINTDVMVLDRSACENVLAIGKKLTGGYGAGGDPSIGAAAAEESVEELTNLLSGCNMVILTGGMGGGTGTGAIPVIARLCHELGILTVAVVTKPFAFEGMKRMQEAVTGIEKLRQYVDTLFIIPNDKLLAMNDKAMCVEDGFLFADSVLQNTIQAINNIILNCGTVNLDFNDLRTVLSNKGEALLGISTIRDSKDFMEGVKNAINSPLLETSIAGAKYLLLNCSGRVNLLELNAAVTYLQELTGPETYIMWGTVGSAGDSGDAVNVTIIATGVSSSTGSSQTGGATGTGRSAVGTARGTGMLARNSSAAGSSSHPDSAYKGAARASVPPVRPSVDEIQLIIPDFLQGRRQ